MSRNGFPIRADTRVRKHDDWIYTHGHGFPPALEALYIPQRRDEKELLTDRENEAKNMPWKDDFSRGCYDNHVIDTLKIECDLQ